MALSRRSFFFLATLALVGISRNAHADDVLHPLSTQLDRPTLLSLGVQLLIAGDDNGNAQVTARYRRSGTGDPWRNGLALFRVHPEAVTGLSVPAQFAGSILQLRPSTAYDIELHATDSDGPVDQTLTLSGVTRSIPRDPQNPRAVSVSSTAQLNTALLNAQPGDVITLAAGTYSGPFTITANGTASQPIVVRGAAQATVLLDGNNCSPCNLLEVYSSFLHIEDLTLQHAERAIRFQDTTAEGNVVRRIKVTDTTLGIHGKGNQLDFYICDNVLEGRLTWPLTYGNDNATHASDDGLLVSGEGHVVCHNRVSGYGDALNTGSRAQDFYGNDVPWTYDDGIELDGSVGNVRVFQNRFTNMYDGVSFQPVQGGPVYVFRNVLVNVANEQFKLHALGLMPPEEPSGILLFHNTVVRAEHSFEVSTPNRVRHFAIENSLFIGPTSTSDGFAFRWEQPAADRSGVIDWNGHYPQGKYEFGYDSASGGVTFDSFAAVQADGRWESHGLLLTQSPFANGRLGMPGTYPTGGYGPLLPPEDLSLAAGSAAADRGTFLENIDDNFQGAAPDLGALERGCALPMYGPRPSGIDETNEPLGCEGSAPSSGPDGGTSSNGTSPTGEAPLVRTVIGGCGCGVGAGVLVSDAWVFWGLSILLRRRLRTARRR